METVPGTSTQCSESIYMCANAFQNTCIPPHLHPAARRGAAQHLLTLLLPSGVTAEADTLLSVKEKQPRIGFSFREALKIQLSRPARAALCLVPDTSIPLAAGEPLPCAPCGWQAAPGRCQPPEGRADKEELKGGTLQGSAVHTEPQLTHLGAAATGCFEARSSAPDPPLLVEHQARLAPC